MKYKTPRYKTMSYSLHIKPHETKPEEPKQLLPDLLQADLQYIKAMLERRVANILKRQEHLKALKSTSTNRRFQERFPINYEEDFALILRAEEIIKKLEGFV